MQSGNGESNRARLELSEVLHIATTDGKELAYEVVAILEDPKDGRSYAVLMHEDDAEGDGEFVVTDVDGNLVEDDALAREVLDDFLAFADERDDSEEVTD